MSDAGIHAYDSGRVDPPHHHSPHLAHHFDTMEQQYDSGKLGMWVFLATELLMFGGLFCAYSVYRSNNPDVFLYAHSYLNTTWGAINTAILLASSLTMAWAVRASQLGQSKLLVTLLLATLLGGGGFMVIKAIEYNHKFHDNLAPGYANKYNVAYKKDDGENNQAGVKRMMDELTKEAPKPVPPAGIAATPARPYLYEDPNANGADKAVIVPHFTPNTGLSQAQSYGVAPAFKGHEQTSHNTGQREGEHVAGKDEAEPHHTINFVDMASKLDQQRVNTFFGIYYCMTGLHGVHVLVGMGLIFWITHRAAGTKVKAWIPPLPVLGTGVFLYAISHWNPWWIASIPFLAIGGLWLVVRVAAAARIAPAAVEAGEFSPEYFMPVDLVGLYWHLVDLIWIFLFPLLYLIHGKIG
jgi:cytochrome c oxidase subunit III